MKYFFIALLLTTTTYANAQVSLRDLQYIYDSNMSKADSCLKQRQGSWTLLRDQKSGSMQVWTTTKGHLLTLAKVVGNGDADSFVILNTFTSDSYYAVGGAIVKDVLNGGMKETAGSDYFSDGHYAVSFRDINNNGTTQLAIVFAKKRYFQNDN